MRPITSPGFQLPFEGFSSWAVSPVNPSQGSHWGLASHDRHHSSFDKLSNPLPLEVYRSGQFPSEVSQHWTDCQAQSSSFSTIRQSSSASCGSTISQISVNPAHLGGVGPSTRWPQHSERSSSCVFRGFSDASFDTVPETTSTVAQETEELHRGVESIRADQSESTSTVCKVESPISTILPLTPELKTLPLSKSPKKKKKGVKSEEDDKPVKLVTAITASGKKSHARKVSQ